MGLLAAGGAVASANSTTKTTQPQTEKVAPAIIPKGSQDQNDDPDAALAAELANDQNNAINDPHANLSPKDKANMANTVNGNANAINHDKNATPQQKNDANKAAAAAKKAARHAARRAGAKGGKAYKNQNNKARANGTTPGDLAHKKHDAANAKKAADQNKRNAANAKHAKNIIDNTINSLNNLEGGSLTTKGMTASQLSNLENSVANDASDPDNIPDDIEDAISSDDAANSASASNAAEAAKSAADSKVDSIAASADDAVSNGINSVIASAAKNGENPESAAKSINSSEMDKMRNIATNDLNSGKNPNSDSAFANLISSAANAIKPAPAKPNNGGNNTPNTPNHPSNNDGGNGGNNNTPVNPTPAPSPAPVTPTPQQPATPAKSNVPAKPASDNNNQTSDDLPDGIVFNGQSMSDNSNMAPAKVNYSSHYLHTIKASRRAPVFVELKKGTFAYSKAIFNNRTRRFALNPGDVVSVSRIFSKWGITRMQLTNGLYVTSNKDYAKFISVRNISAAKQAVVRAQKQVRYARTYRARRNAYRALRVAKARYNAITKSLAGVRINGRRNIRRTHINKRAKRNKRSTRKAPYYYAKRNNRKALR